MPAPISPQKGEETTGKGHSVAWGAGAISREREIQMLRSCGPRPGSCEEKAAPLVVTGLCVQRSMTGQSGNPDISTCSVADWDVAPDRKALPGAAFYREARAAQLQTGEGSSRDLPAEFWWTNKHREGWDSKVFSPSLADVPKIVYDIALIPQNLKKSNFFFLFWLRRAACEILVPRPGIEPWPWAVRTPSPNHWTAREFPRKVIFIW